MSCCFTRKNVNFSSGRRESPGSKSSKTTFELSVERNMATLFTFL